MAFYLVAAIAVIFCGRSDANPLFRKHTLDMSYNFNNRTIYWPTGQIANFTLTVRQTSLPSSSVVYSTGDYIAGEHGGTHMDSPLHTNKNGITIDQITVDRLQAPAVVLDVRHQVNRNHRYMATREDYNKWEEKYGRMPDKAVFLLCTGWERNYPDKNKVYGTSNLYDITTMNYPGMDPKLVEWLIANRKLNGIGIDTPTPDGAQTIATFPIHIMTAAKNIFILENVKGVCDIPPSGTTLLIFPMKIEGGTGAPTRIVGTWGEEVGDSWSCACALHPGTLLLILVTILNRMY